MNYEIYIEIHKSAQHIKDNNSLLTAHRPSVCLSNKNNIRPAVSRWVSLSWKSVFGLTVTLTF